MTRRNVSEKRKKAVPLTVIINLQVAPELKRLVAEASDNHNPPISMNECVVKILAQYFNRHDLSVVPRKRQGRPRKEMLLR